VPNGESENKGEQAHAYIWHGIEGEDPLTVWRSEMQGFVEELKTERSAQRQDNKDFKRELRLGILLLILTTLLAHYWK